MLWHIGNTTVRTPYRLGDALRCLQGSPLNGNLSGPEQENAFAALLHHEKIVYAPRIAQGGNAPDLGRKWRSALSQLGFVTPQLTRGTKTGTVEPALIAKTENLKELSGRPYEITPNGYRLAQSTIITAQQECFLRSLSNYLIPSVIETHYEGEPFSPLRFILRIMTEIEERDHKPVLSFQEFAFFVQTATPSDSMDTIVTNLVDYREGRIRNKGKVRDYDQEFCRKIARSVDRKESTLGDYADLTFRYLKATGLFRSAGRGVCLSPSRVTLAELLRDQDDPESSDEYLPDLWMGAQLPTDNAEASYTVVQNLILQLKNRGVDAEIPPAHSPLPDLERIRHELDARLLQLDEQDYAGSQSEQLDEILAWIEAIQTRGTANLPDGGSVSIPKGEGPAYLEWIIWRAFLAIDNLCNQPWDARRFQIDQNFLPSHCAPGGGPDMIFEFEDYIVVVEVTLTDSSRQEAAEGEPVRRHVAQHAVDSDKPVYGLFVAVKIDSNTAHTFRTGDWYKKDDTKLALDIVPVTLADFSTFLASGRDRFSDMPDLLRQIIIECRARANQDAPQWKHSISRIIQKSGTIPEI